MTKAQTQLTQITTVEESPTFKRERMKQMRKIVADAVKHDKRIDLMGFEGSDIARTQIALQDLLTKTQERHQKATNHLAKIKQFNDMCADIFNDVADKIMEQQETITELSTALYNERMDHMQTSVELQKMYDDKCEAEQTINSMKQTFRILND